MSQLQLNFDVWPPLEFCLPNLDELERISRGEVPEPPAERDNSKAGRLARLTADRLTGGIGKMVSSRKNKGDGP